MGNFSNYWDLHTLFTKLKNKLKSISDKIDDSVSLKTATGNPITLTDAANANAEELLMTIEPIQDLHGYSKPWPAGGGKNLLPMTVEGIKTVNTDGTWSGNVYTKNGSTVTIQTDGDGNVIGIKISGQPSAAFDFVLYSNLSVTSDSVLNASSDKNTSNNSCTLYIGSYGIGSIAWMSDSVNVPANTTADCSIYIANTFNDTVIVKPMIRLATETDAIFAPYTNICPISGLTSGEVETTDGTDTNTASITFGQTVYGGSVNFKTGEVTVTHGMADLGTLTDWEFAGRGVDNGYIYKIVSFTTIPRKLLNCVGLSNKLFQYNSTSYSMTKINSFNLGHLTVSLFVGSTFDTLDDFKTAMSGVQVLYELATPTTLTLTPAELELLKGNNTITANGAEISLSYYPDNAIGALAERVDDKADKPTSTANGGLIPLWNLANGKLNYYSDEAKLFGVTIESGNPKLRSQSSSSTYANFSASGYEHISGHSLIRVNAADGIVGSGNGGYNFDLTREKLSYLNNIKSDVQGQINRFKYNMISPATLNTYTNNGVRTIYQSVMAYINGLSASSKPRGFVQFMLTYEANTMPSDLPFSNTKGYYAWGEIYFRNTDYVDATIILHPYADDGTMIIKQVLNSEEKTWQTVLTDKSDIADTDEFTIELPSGWTKPGKSTYTLQFIKRGKIVCVYCTGIYTGSINQTVHVGTLPTKFNPLIKTEIKINNLVVDPITDYNPAVSFSFLTDGCIIIYGYGKANIDINFSNYIGSYPVA